MTDELGAISVGLKVGLGTLDADLRNIQKKIEPIAKEHSISFKVGSVNVTEVRNQIRTITQGKIPLPVTLTVPANSGTVIRRTLTTQLRAAGPVLVQVTASLRPTDISRIKREIELAMRQAGPVNVPFNTGGTGRGGGGGGGGAPPTGGQPVTPTPRAPRTPSGARGAPEGPSAASAPTAAPAPTATPARPSRGRTAREAREATTASTTTAEPTSQPRAAPTTTRAARATQPGQAPAAGAAPTPRAAPAAAPPPRPTANFGAILPTGAASSVVQRRQGTPDPEALSLAETAETGPRAARFLAHRAQRAAGRTVSLNTLRDDKVHTNVPETPEEIEDASRRWQVRVPMSLQEADAASERGGRGRGTRGARLSGARLPGEPVLTDMDTLARDNIQHQKAEANRAERDAAIRAPARRSGAFYGSRGNNPAFNRMLSGLQYLKFDPVLGEAFGAFERGELGETRALLKGFGGKLAGADPRARSRFFKMLRNSEKNVSGGLLEKHAAFQALITETGLSEAQVTVDRAESAVAAFPKPKGRQADWPEPARDEWQRLIAQRSLVQRTYQNTLRGMRPAKRGDAPRGPTGSSPAHLGGARVGLDDAIRAMNEGRMTRAEFEVKFPGFKEREGGGRVGGYREPGPSEDLDAKWAAPTRLPYRDDMPKEAGGRISEIARLLGPLKAEVDEEGWEKWGPKQKKYAALLHEQDRLHTTWRRREGGGRIEGRERGGTVASGRIHGTRQWRKMSVAQRAAQPFCTYCQTFGTAKNPLQADHIKAIAEGGAPYEPRNITTACAKCNLLKRGQEGWGPPSRAPRGVTGREGGGPVEGPLQRRIRMAKEAKIAKQAYLVGEKKPEAFIGDSGRIEIVGEDGPEIRVFPESGKVLPYVPEWVRRGMAKDLTGREVGGRVYKGRLAAEEGSGVGRADVIGGGTMKFRDPFEGEKEAIVAGKLSPSGSVQRVWVVNMPAGGFGGGGAASAPTGAMRAAGPTVGRSIDDPFASLRELIEETVEVGQAAPASPRVARARQELLDPAERALGRISSRQEVAGPEAELSGMAHELSEKEQRIPSRGPAVMFGQLFQVLFGGRSTAQTRIKETRDAIGKANQATASWRAEQEKLNNAVTLLGKTDPETHPEAYAEAEKEVDKLTASTRDWREEQQLLTEVARGLSEKVLTTSSAVRVAATGIAGLAAGTVVFSAVLGATQMALGLVVPAVQAVTDRMGGYQNAANEMTATLAQQIRAQNGSVEATLAQSQAQIGLGANTARAINPLLSQTAMIEAGSMALRDQIALLRAYEGLQQRQGGMTFPRGLVDTQGGLNILGVQTPFGGTPSVLEQLNNELGRQSGVATNPIERLGQLLDPMGPDPEKKIAEINERQSGFDRFIGYDREADIGLKGRPIGEFLFGTEESKAEGKPPPWTSLLPRMVRDSYGTEPSSPPLSPEREKGLARLREAVNEPIERAGGSMKLMSAETDTLRDAQKRQADALKSSGIPRLEEFAERLENSNTVLGGVSSDPVQLIDDVLKGLEDMTRGATIPDVEVLLKQFTERIIPAQKALFAAQGNFQRNQLIPAQFALQSLAAPTPGTGGVPFEAGTVGRDLITGEVDSAAAAAAKSVKSKLGGAVEFINSQIATGRSQLIELASLGGRGAEFTTLLEDIEATGKAISGLQLGIQQRQADLQVSEYNNQLRIARRSLKDIKDTQAGIAGETRNTIGGLEGQNIALQRQLQLLQFSLQQRQINFRLATAGFVAPGTTPEERAARIEAAKEEAAFAQKQLDIQKKIADNQYRSMAGQVSGGNQLQRNIEDLSRQIGLLEEGKKITIQTVVDSRSLDVQNKKMGLLIQQAGTYVEEGTKITQSQMEATADIVRQTGAAFGDVLDATAKAWGIFGTQYRMALMGGAPSKSKGPTSWGNYASGIVGDTLGPTQITVGEAAGEKVAVLKNPKLMPSSILASTGVGAASSGSLIQMTVIISGNSVREDTDLQTLADLVSQKVEDRLMRKTSLFGLRRI